MRSQNYCSHQKKTNITFPNYAQSTVWFTVHRIFKIWCRMNMCTTCDGRWSNNLSRVKKLWISRIATKNHILPQTVENEFTVFYTIFMDDAGKCGRRERTKVIWTMFLSKPLVRVMVDSSGLRATQFGWPTLVIPFDKAFPLFVAGMGRGKARLLQFLECEGRYIPTQFSAK